MKNVVHTDGPIFSFLDKAGRLIVLSVLWLAGCVPVVTCGTSTAALYYAVVKSIRHERGNATAEFWDSYKRNLLRGVLVTAPSLIAAALLVFNIWLLKDAGGGVFVGSVILLLLLAGCWVYIGPVLSRFSMKPWEACKLAFIMALKFLPYTLLLLLGTGALALMQFYILPVAAALVIPGAWCYVSTCLVEKALHRFMPEKTEGDDAWYYES